MHPGEGRLLVSNSPHVPIKSPQNMMRESAIAVEESKQGVQPQPYMIFPLVVQCFMARERWLAPPCVSLGLHDVHTGEGQPLSSKNASINTQSDP